MAYSIEKELSQKEKPLFEKRRFFA